MRQKGELDEKRAAVETAVDKTKELAKTGAEKTTDALKKGAVKTGEAVEKLIAEAFALSRDHLQKAKAAIELP